MSFFHLTFFLCPAGGVAVREQLGQCLAAKQGQPTTYVNEKYLGFAALLKVHHLLRHVDFVTSTKR